jgi:hydrogenase maturation protease
MADHRAHQTLILGVGNPLMGDDAVGIIAVERLRERPDLPPGVSVIDGGTDGLGLIPVMEGHRRVVVVDAVEMALPPGTIRRFLWREVRSLGQNGGSLSLHQTDLAGALSLADALGSLPPNVIVFGVQPQVVEWDAPLSPAVERALPVLIDALINEVRSNDTYGEENSDY